MYHVLIAEDDRILAARMVKALEKHAERLEVTAVDNGKEAMEVLRRRPVSLLVTDIKMPEMDGLELLGHVSRHHPTVLSFVITGHSTPELQRNLPEEVVRYFEKPIDVEKLSQSILQVLERDLPRGVVSGISVMRFLRLLQMERKTCWLEVRPFGKPKGRLFFDNGELWDATFGDLQGEAAALALIAQERADIRFLYFPEQKRARCIATDLESLIEKALGRPEERTGDPADAAP